MASQNRRRNINHSGFFIYISIIIHANIWTVQLSKREFSDKVCDSTPHNSKLRCHQITLAVLSETWKMAKFSQKDRSIKSEYEVYISPCDLLVTMTLPFKLCTPHALSSFILLHYISTSSFSIFSRDSIVCACHEHVWNFR